MSSDDCQLQNIYRYSRKTYKKNRRHEECSPREEPANAEVAETPRSERATDWCNLDRENASCSCDPDPETEVASILHKKCPVISLAQQQLQRLLDGTDKLLCDNTRCCRSLYDFYCICKELLTTQNKAQCALFILIGVAFLVGILFGAATCGSHLGHFDSPILGCIDNYFIPDAYPTIEESFRSIV